MSWTDYYLRFQDEATWLAINPWGDALFSHEHAVDVVGLLYQDDTLEPVVLDGFHVNLRLKGDIPSVLESYVIPVPQHPKRRFAGE